MKKMFKVLFGVFGVVLVLLGVLSPAAPAIATQESFYTYCEDLVGREYCAIIRDQVIVSNLAPDQKLEVARYCKKDGGVEVILGLRPDQVGCKFSIL